MKSPDHRSPEQTDLIGPDAEWTRKAVLTVEEVAAVLRLGRSATYNAVRKGQIPSRRFGRRILVPVSALQAMLEPEGSRVAEPTAQNEQQSAVSWIGPTPVA